MKAAVLTGIRAMEVLEVPAPRISRPTDVLVRMGAVGICGSDVHYYLSGGIGGMRVAYPFTVGHEGAGVVSETGAAVKRVAPGDRVVIEPAISCRECDQCRAGRPNTCRALRFVSCPGEASGCLCEYIVIPEENCYRIDGPMGLELAAMAEPLSIGIYAVRQSVPMLGARIAVLGSGPIGLSVVLAAKAAGASAAYVTEKIEERLAAARAAGADWTGDPEEEDIVEEIARREPLQLDAVFECCGDQGALDQGIDLLAPGGMLVILGIPENRRISFDVDSMRRKEVTIYYVRRQRYCIQDALDAIASGRVRPEFMLTHRFPLAQAPEAFDLVARYGDGVIKAMVMPC